MSLANDRISSQGFSLISDATKVSIKTARNNSAAAQLDASDLSLSDGSTRVYVDGLTDNGPNGTSSGKTVTITAEGYGNKPSIGDTVSVDGVTCKCTESQYDNNVGELRSWSASFTSDFPSVS